MGESDLREVTNVRQPTLEFEGGSAPVGGMLGMTPRELAGLVNLALMVGRGRVSMATLVAAVELYGVRRKA